MLAPPPKVGALSYEESWIQPCIMYRPEETHLEQTIWSGQVEWYVDCAIRFRQVPSPYTQGNTCNVFLPPDPPRKTRTGSL